MRNRLIMVAALLFALAGCYKDKGNYDYHVVEEPIVTNLDTVYTVFVGDSLVVAPVIKFSKPAALGFEWKIAVPELLSDVRFTGPAIRTIYTMAAKRYSARLTISDSSTGMKYFYDFKVSGVTPYSQGTAVLSDDGGKAILSFIKTDGTVIPNIYEVFNPNATLGHKPRQLIGLRHNSIAPYHLSSYWVFTDEDEKGVQINPNDMKKKNNLAGNFFTPPATLQPGTFIGTDLGVMNGVLNGKLYNGLWQTWNENPLYGMFGLPAEGDYNLFHMAAFNTVLPYFLGYDKDRKQVVGFTNFGSPAYIGIGYSVEGNAFDPKNIGLDLDYFVQVNNANLFAMGRDAAGNLKEIKSGVEFRGLPYLKPEYSRNFSQPALIKPTTKWTFAPAEIFYFTSGDKVYRYNPLNQDIRLLTTDFGGKEVTMVKVIDGGNVLLAGTEGTLYTLDISTGKFGDVIKKQTGIPGQIIDAVIRNDR